MPQSKSTTFVFIACFIAATSANCSSNRTCLDLKLIDMYGDGWDGARFFLDTPWKEVFSDAPTCDMNPVLHTFCTDQSGVYSMVLIHDNESYVPENYWESLYTVTPSKCGSTSETYTGGYNTTMIWEYEESSDEWSVAYWENLWENTKECDACGDSRACKPKPKHKHKKKPSASKPHSSHSYQNYTKPKPRYGPPAVNTRVTMFSEEENGWWQSDYMGASWYLADDTRTELFHTGTLCNGGDKAGPAGREGGKSGYCNLCLGDGSYTMRFTGDASDFNSWDFCGIVGGHSQELTFHIKKGKCIPDSLITLETDCFGAVVSTVTVSGVLSLTGFTSEFINSKDIAVVPEVLADFMTGLDARRISILSTTLDSRALSMAESVSRKLAEFTVDVQFEVSFEAESDYGVDGRDFRKVQNLVYNLQSAFDSQISTESFLFGLSTAAKLSDAPSLGEVHSVKLVSLDLEDISYQGVEAMVTSELPAAQYLEYENTVTVSSYEFSTVAVFFGAGAVGFLAFIGLISHGVNGYKRVSQMGDSEHEVLESEMDSTISNVLPDPSVSANRRSLSAGL